VRYLANSGNGRPVTEAYSGRYHLVSEAAGYESVQNNLNDSTSRRELTIVVLAATVVRCLCWVPIQIFMLVDIFTESSTAEYPDRRGGGSAMRGSKDVVDMDVYRQVEQFTICFAYAAACINPFIYNCACAEFRRVNIRMLSACCPCFRRKDRLRQGDNRTAGQGLMSGRPASPGELLSSKPVGAATEEAGGMGLRLGDMNETIMSIISDSSNRINYA